MKIVYGLCESCPKCGSQPLSVLDKQTRYIESADYRRETIFITKQCDICKQLVKETHSNIISGKIRPTRDHLSPPSRWDT